SQTFLQSVAGTMSKAPAGTHIEIGGHTDSTGDPEKNLALSQARADAVRQALIDHGVAPEMLSAKGYGGTQPIASNDTAQGRERNRRIAFSVR
ncbi:MAG: OmpA family protein, partial [Rhodospirillales bacterium]|nr:OmpA family protein [Rhodospirillales bacterium]